MGVFSAIFAFFKFCYRSNSTKWFHHGLQLFSNDFTQPQPAEASHFRGLNTICSRKAFPLESCLSNNYFETDNECTILINVLLIACLRGNVIAYFSKKEKKTILLTDRDAL